MNTLLFVLSVLIILVGCLCLGLGFYIKMQMMHMETMTSPHREKGTRFIHALMKVQKGDFLKLYLTTQNIIVTGMGLLIFGGLLFVLKILLRILK